MRLFVVRPINMCGECKARQSCRWFTVQDISSARPFSTGLTLIGYCAECAANMTAVDVQFSNEVSEEEAIVMDLHES